MKNIATFIGLIFLIVGCSTPLTKENVQGTWQMTNLETNTDVSETIIATAKEMAKSTVYEFQKETFTVKSDYQGEAMMEDGSWDIDANQKKLYLTFKSEYGISAIEYTIQTFTSSKMVWIDDMGELGKNWLTLEKQ